MKKDAKRFRGCLKEKYKGYVDEILIEYLIENEIIFKDENIENRWGAPHYKKIQFPLLHDNNLYFPNNDILLDIYDVLEVGNRSKIVKKGELSYMDEMGLISKKVYSEYSVEDKLKILQNYRKKLIEKVDFSAYMSYTEDSKSNPYNDDLTFYIQKDHYNWKAQIMLNAFKDFYAIEYYLQNDFRLYIFDDVLEKSDNLFSSNSDININWRINDRTEWLVNFIEGKIKELKENDKSDYINEPTEQESSKTDKLDKIFLLLKEVLEKKYNFKLDDHKFNRHQSFKSNDPFYRVLYLDTLRELNKLKKITSKELRLYLTTLNKLKFKNEEEQINSFCSFLELNDVLYSNYKSNQLANEIADIVGSETNSKIKDFTPFVVKSSEEWSERQIKLFKNKCIVIYQIYNDLKIINKV
jgi:hypothetical protein